MPEDNTATSESLRTGNLELFIQRGKMWKKKDFFRYTKAEEIYHQQNFTQAMIKEVLWAESKWFKKNLIIHKGMISIRNSEYWVNVKEIFSYFKKS